MNAFVRCPNCRVRLQVSFGKIPSSITCPKCQQAFQPADIQFGPPRSARVSSPPPVSDAPPAEPFPAEAPAAESSAYNIADLLDEPQRKPESSLQSSAAPAQSAPNRRRGSADARRRLRRELEQIRAVLTANAHETAAAIAEERATSKEEEAIAKVEQLERQTQAESRRRGQFWFKVASVTLGALPTGFLAMANPSFFGQKTMLEEMGINESDSGTGPPRLTAYLPESLARRQAALEEVARGESGSLHVVYRLGAFLAAAAAFALCSVLAYVCTLMHPLLGVFGVPMALIAPICWWFDELGALGAALRDHPDVFRPPGLSLRRLHLLYPPLCLAVLALGGVVMGVACYRTGHWVHEFFTS